VVSVSPGILSAISETCIELAPILVIIAHSRCYRKVHEEGMLISEDLETATMELKISTGIYEAELVQRTRSFNEKNAV